MASGDDFEPSSAESAIYQMSRRLACDRNGGLKIFILEINKQHSLMLNTVEYSHQKFHGSVDKKLLVLLI